MNGIYYLNVSDQQSEQHQATKNNDYAEYNFQPMTCRLKIIAKRTEKCNDYYTSLFSLFQLSSIKQIAFTLESLGPRKWDRGS